MINKTNPSLLAPSSPMDELAVASSALPALCKPDKRFRRLDKPFNDAVRSKKKSAVTSVLLRADLPVDLAARTAEKVLAKRRRTQS